MEEEVFNIENAYTLVTEKLESWAESAIQMLPNLVIAILIVLAFVVIAKLIKRLSLKLLKKATDNQGLQRLISTVIYIVVICAGIFIALSVLKLTGTVTSLLAGVGIIGLGLAFAFQEIASNYMAGTMMSVQKPFKVGDLIKTNDYFGKVTEMRLRTTRLTTLQGQLVMIPNSLVYKNPIENFSVTGRRRVDLELRISYVDDLEQAKELALKTIKGIEGVKDEDVSLYYNEFADSSINFKVRYWMPFTNKNFEYWDMVDKGIIAIKKAFDKAGIDIPFPIRTLDFGDLNVRELVSNKTSDKKG